MANTTAKGYTNLIDCLNKELDLRNQQTVKDFMAAEKPEVIIDCRKSGGSWPTMIFYQFIMDKSNNLIDTALQSGVSLFFGSSCIYPNWPC
jgi:GDP-L-fucose synthase